MIATNGGVRIAWEETGDGEAVLLIHGLGYARWGWEPLVPMLAERFRVITFDNRGIGASDVPPGPYTAAEMAGDARAVLDAAGVERAHVVGASLGGMVAQELAIAWREGVDRLVLVCTTPGGSAAYPMPEVTSRLIAEARDLAPDVALRRFVENALAPKPEPALVERILAHRITNPQDPAGWQAQAAAGTTYDGARRAERILAPTLLVSGTADAVVDHRNSVLLSQMIPDARLQLIEGAGHLVFWEHPRTVADLITEHLL
jgi:pimeloyl-ACP methyl ester carboxylesterase